MRRTLATLSGLLAFLTAARAPATVRRAWLEADKIQQGLTA